MKFIKILSLVLSFIIFMFTIGCSLPIDFDDEIFSDSYIGDSESTVSKEEGSDSLLSDTSETYKIPDEEVPNQYRFTSVEDLHTYVTTGSTDPNDYRNTSKTLLEQYPSPEEMKVGYLPIIDLFDLGEAEIDFLSRVDLVENSQAQAYGYLFKEKNSDICFSVVLEYSNNDRDANTESGTVIYYDMSAKNEYDECTIQQSINGTAIYYSTKYGKIGCILFYYDNHMVRMAIDNFNGYNVTENEIKASYDSFMTAPESATFAPFFSEDQAVREEAFAKFEANYAEIVNRAE